MAGQRIGIFGGTFDPIHVGHLNAATIVADQFDLDQVVFMPAGQPWLKTDVQASSEDRYTMVQLAIVGDDRFVVSRMEIDRPGPTYTIDSLVALRRLPEFGDAELFFITGADAIAGITSWKDHTQLAELATFVAVTRPGTSQTSAALRAEFPVLQIDTTGIDVSSSMVRDRVRRNESISELTPPAVVDYIAGHGLYRDLDREPDRLVTR